MATRTGEFEAIEAKFGGLRGVEIERALANYQTVAEAARAAVELQQDADDLIEYVNSGQLPVGHMVTTLGDSRIPLWAIPNDWTREEARRSPKAYPEHATLIYRPNEAGEYVLDGEIATGSSTQVFLGDRILKLDNEQLVIINSEHQVGITPSEKVAIVDLLNDPYKNTLGGSHEKRFSFFLGVIDSVRYGVQIHEDLSWG